MDTLHKVDFSVPLSGSHLFDIGVYATARKLCAKFPGLDFEYGNHFVHIFGELNDMWYDKWNKAVFEIGNIEIRD